MFSFRGVFDGTAHFSLCAIYFRFSCVSFFYDSFKPNTHFLLKKVLNKSYLSSFRNFRHRSRWAFLCAKIGAGNKASFLRWFGVRIFLKFNKKKQFFKKKWDSNLIKHRFCKNILTLSLIKIFFLTQNFFIFQHSS